MFKNVLLVGGVILLSLQSVAILKIDDSLKEQTENTAEAVLQASQRAQNKYLVYEVCQDSRIDNKMSESACGELQDRLSIEYMCKENNNKETNKCWTEVK